MDVLMPQLGETVTEGTVNQWFKAVGDQVKAGEMLFEIETDKTSMEVEATMSGVLAEIRVETGATVAVGTAIAVIAAEGEVIAPAAASTPQSAASAPQAASEPAPAPARSTAPEGFGPFSEVRTPIDNFGPAKAGNGLRVTPLARRLAAQHGINLDQLAQQRSNAGATRIAKADVLAYAEVPASIPAPTPRTVAGGSDAGGSGSDVIQLNRIRRATGNHLAKAWAEIPHVFQAVEVDFQAVERVRRALNDANAERSGFRLTYLPFIARAVCLAIRAYPQVNASVDDRQLVVHRRINLGIAVDLAHDGLVVPVIHGADDLNLIGMARAIAEITAKARANGLTEDDISGGTYTISNSGSFGTLITAPIVNAPQVAILSSDGVRKRPVVVEDPEDGDRIAIHPVGVIGQSFDHRAFDGAYSAAFLNEIRTILGTRDWLAEAR